MSAFVRLHREERGFTLIELLVVVAIIGILAAVAFPKFVDASNEAKIGVVKASAGAVASASATNYALRVANPSSSATIAVVDCTAASWSTITQLPTGVTVGDPTSAHTADKLPGAATTASGSLYWCGVTDGTNTTDVQVVGAK
jgi:prepilin-type N-terminal cleavage/methylation domain-containing protein